MNKSLTEQQVSALTGINRPLLKQWRKRGKGPPFEKTRHGIRYEYRDLKVWMEQNSYQENECGCENCSDLSNEIAAMHAFINSKGLLEEYISMS